MNIEFNTSRITKSELPPPRTAAAGASTAATNDTASLDGTEFLSRQVQNPSPIRPEKVAQAQALVGDVKYPPIQTLQEIANLLAIHLGSE